MILPGFGVISQIVSTFSRKPIFGYLGMAYAMVAIGGIGLWWTQRSAQTAPVYVTAPPLSLACTAGDAEVVTRLLAG